MSKPVILSMKKNFIYSILGNLSFALSQWIIIVILAKMTTPEVLGQYSLGLAITIPIFLILGMNFRSLIATDQSEKFLFNEYYYTRILLSFCGVVLSLLMAVILNFNKEITFFIIILSVYRFFESVCDISHGLFQKHERIKVMSYSKILQSLVSIIMFTFSLYILGNVYLALIIQSFSFLLTFLLYNFREIKKIERDMKLFSLANLKKVMKKKSKLLIYLGFPLGVTAALDSFNTNVPRFLIQYYLGEWHVGIYSSIVNIMIAIGTIVAALCHAAIPRISNYYASKKITLLKVFLNKLILIGVVIGVVSIVVSLALGEEILKLFYTVEYSNYKNSLVLMMVAGLFWYLTSFFATALIAIKKYGIQIPILLFSMLSTIIFSILLVPNLGLNGAIISVILSNIIRLILSIFIFNKALKNDHQELINTIG